VAIGVASGDGCYWAAAPLHLKDARQRREGSVLEKLLLRRVNLKILVLSAGLAVMGMTGSTWAETICKNSQIHGEVRADGNYCSTKTYPYNSSSKCTCPNPDYKSEKTHKCYVYNSISDYMQKVYHCETP